ncbi:MAG: aldo/keto reductase [Deltaproteobacteria bacterium]|nr:aldo/keto reductase [Deltaproteobacteria bacterium]
MTILNETYTLPNGVEIPKLGLGTWMIGDDTVARAVKEAATIGYRHIDTAQAYQTPAELIEYTQALGILVEAYSPIAHGELLKNDQVTAMASRYGVSVPQLSIRYDLQLGLLPLPKTSNAAHMKSNADVDFVIAREDMDVLKNLPKIDNYGEASFMPVFGGGRRSKTGAQRN